MRSTPIFLTAILAVAAASCTDAGEDNRSIQAAIDDLQIVDGGSCGVAGVEKILENTNKQKRIVATVSATGSVADVPLLDAKRGPVRERWPRTYEIRLAAGGREQIGCTVWPLRKLDVAQTFSIAGAYYTQDDVTFPTPGVDPLGVARFVQAPNTLGGSCQTVEFVANAHPARRIIVDWKATDGSPHEGFNMPVDPQGVARPVGCATGENGRPRNYEVVRARWG